MNFQKIPVIEDYTHYLDVAFNRAKIRVDQQRQKTKKKREDAFDHIKTIEEFRLSSVRDTLTERFNKILRSFPEMNLLSPYYQELIRTTTDYLKIMAACETLAWAVQTIKTIHYEHNRKLMRARQPEKIHEIRRSFYGRVSSVVEQAKTALTALEKARKVMRSYPIIKDLPTVAIAGFPNVGKTTLLSKISASKPEIAEYAFTTKHINMGYMKLDSREIQLIDTPGTLARLDKMNSIEKQAFLAIKYLAHIIVYIFDPTEPYPLEMQENLLAIIQEEKKQLVLYISKTDEPGKEMVIAKLKKKYPSIITEPSVLQERLFSLLKKG